MGGSLLLAIGLLVFLLMTVVLLFVWIVTKNSDIGKFLGLIWISVIVVVLLFNFLVWVNSKTVLDKQDYHGAYVINRDYFAGKQTDWQYNHYRFEITKEDSIFFYVTDEEKIIKTYKGIIGTTGTTYKSVRLIVNMEEPSHHIVQSNPITYRSSWTFYLVFHSEIFHNVFFKKGKWKPLN